MVNTLIRKLKGTVSAFAAILAFGAFADVAITPQTDFGDISPTAKLKAVVEASGAISGIDTNAVDASANSAVVTNALTVATTNRVAAHVKNTDNPHSVTAAQVGAVPLVEDVNGTKTAVTIGIRMVGSKVGEHSIANGLDVSASGHYCHAEGASTTALGNFSHAEGSYTTASGEYSHAEGSYTIASGEYSHAEGSYTIASGKHSHAEGAGTTAAGNYSHADGVMSQTLSGNYYAYAWNGDEEIQYSSHGPGTFNINPIGGLGGFFIGDRSLQDIFDGRYLRSDSQGGPPGYVYINTNVYFSTARTGNLFVDSFSNIRQYDEHGEPLENWVKYIVGTRIDANDSDFSNAVLAVGLNIDTNSVAVLNEIASTFGGFPVEGTATTVGGLLAALAAAVAWLKKNKVGSFDSVGGATATVESGVAKLDDFFTESNSLLTGTIDARLPYPLYTVPSTGLLKDRSINTTSLASVTVPDNFTDLLIRASVASSLSVTMPEAIATKYGDTFPGEAGEYLITITKTGAAEAYVRTIKQEEVA